MKKAMLILPALLLALATSAEAVTVTVSGASDLWLAGVPTGATASLGDAAPGHSPAMVSGLSFKAGDIFRFTASGQTDHCANASCGLAGAEGDRFEGIFQHTTGAEHGIGDISAPIDSLIGVFLGSNLAGQRPTPTALDFSTVASRNFASLSPLLNQPFFIGDGQRDDNATAQAFFVPEGATALYLGTMDGFGWFNNVGTLRVTVAVEDAGIPGVGAAPSSFSLQKLRGDVLDVGELSVVPSSTGVGGASRLLTAFSPEVALLSTPEPGTLALLGLGLAGLAAWRRRTIQ